MLLGVAPILVGSTSMVLAIVDNANGANDEPNKVDDDDDDDDKDDDDDNDDDNTSCIFDAFVSFIRSRSPPSFIRSFLPSFLPSFLSLSFFPFLASKCLSCASARSILVIAHIFSVQHLSHLRKTMAVLTTNSDFQSLAKTVVNAQTVCKQQVRHRILSLFVTLQTVPNCTEYKPMHTASPINASSGDERNRDKLIVCWIGYSVLVVECPLLFRNVSGQSPDMRWRVMCPVGSSSGWNRRIPSVRIPW